MVKLLDCLLDNYYKCQGFCEELKDALDVIFMESGIEFCRFNTMEMRKNCGMTSYNKKMGQVMDSVLIQDDSLEIQRS